MITQLRNKYQSSRLSKVGLFLSACWILIIGCFLWWEIIHQKKSVYKLAAIEARAAFNKDLVYRRWSAANGGTYVLATDKTPPNPYLSHLDERDIISPSGKHLTLVNPAYMTRQVHELGEKQYGIKGHITSLNPLRPENQPDQWETDALKAFEKGENEVQTFSLIGEVKYLRLMRPMVTEKSCLSCHAAQGYREGDLRGGISVSIPLRPYETIANENIKKLFAVHLSIILLGLFGLTFTFFILNKLDRRQKEVERSLRESEKKYRLVIENQTDLIVTFDTEGHLLFVSPSYCKAFNKAEEELLGKQFFPLIHEEDRENVVKAIKDVYKHPYTSYIEERAMTKDGWCWQAWLNTAVLNKDGGVESIVAVGRDISMQKRAEEELKIQKIFLYRVIDQSPFAIWISDAEGTLLRTNQALRQALNLTDEQLVGKYNVLKDPLVERQGLAPLIRTVFEEGKTINFACNWNGNDIPTLDLKGSKSVSIEATMFPLHDSKGQLTNVVLNWVDVTERQRTEEELVRVAQQLSAHMDNSPLAVVEFDPDFRVIRWSEEAEKVFGWTAEEIVGKTISEMRWVYDEDIELVNQESNGLLTGEKSRSLSINRNYHKDGSVIHCEWYNSSIHDHQGRLISVLSLVLDITERKQLEEQLLQSQKMESIGTLAGGIAHDFNNILSPIMIHSEMAMENLPADSPLQFNIKEIFKAGERARDLVKQILTFSRKRTADYSNLKITPILKETIKLLRSTIPTTIEIVQRIETDEDIIFSDPTQIHQLILNLCTNAAHSMKGKGGILEIILRKIKIDSSNKEKYSELPSGAYIRLRVKDTGHGMDKATMDNIYEPYFTTKGVGEGTGLGLAVAHGIVKDSGGDILVKSEIGKGTVFDVLLPIIHSDVSDQKERTSSLARGYERILFVDDELPAVNAHKAMLVSLGYNVTARTSSIEALELFRNNPAAFDLVITDMTMPNMTGKELAKEMLSIRSDIPIIICTGFSEQMDDDRAKQIGIKAFIMKPIVMRDIAQTIRRVLEG